jgi:methylphosphotriester-DNA--protein-cysteine methyltransferase
VAEWLSSLEKEMKKKEEEKKNLEQLLKQKTEQLSVLKSIFQNAKGMLP